MIKRYNAYPGCNTGMNQIARECDDGEWVRVEDLKKLLGLFTKQDVQSEVDEAVKDALAEYRFNVGMR